MRFLCFHKWAKWGKPIETYNGGHKQQWGGCTKCGKVSFRNLGWDKQVSISNVYKSLDIM